MLITKQRQFNDEIGENAKCVYCNQRLGLPPVLEVVGYSRSFYHPKCAMQIVYSVLEDLTGVKPELPQQKAPEP